MFTQHRSMLYLHLMAFGVSGSAFRFPKATTTFDLGTPASVLTAFLFLGEIPGIHNLKAGLTLVPDDPKKFRPKSEAEQGAFCNSGKAAALTPTPPRCYSMVDKHPGLFECG